MREGQSFLQGAVILAAAGLVSKLLGAVYRIALPLLLPAQGLGLYGMAYPVFAAFLVMSSTGAPSAIAKLVAEYEARGRVGLAGRVLRVAMTGLAVLGISLSLLLWLIAPTYAKLILGDPRAALPLRAIAPAIGLVSIMGSLRGWYQGQQQMAPYAWSQIIEQIVRVGTIFALVITLTPLGLEWGAAGAAFGAVTGAAAGLAFLLWQLGRGAREENTTGDYSSGSAGGPSSLAILVRLVKFALPVAVAGLVFPAINFLDSVIVPKRLQAAGFAAHQATALYGILTQEAMVFISIPTVVTTALALSLIPAISAASGKGDTTLARRRLVAGLRVAVIFNLGAAAGLWVLSDRIPQVFWHSTTPGPLIRILAAGIVFLGIQQVTSAVLQGSGWPLVPAFSLLVGLVVKFAFTWYFAAQPGWGVQAAAAGTVLAFVATAASNLLFVSWRFGQVLQWRGMLLKPLFAALGMVALVKALYLLVPFGGNQLWYLLLTVLLGALGYLVILAAAGGLRRQDLRLLPKVGPALGNWMTEAGLLK